MTRAILSVGTVAGAALGWLLLGRSGPLPVPVADVPAEVLAPPIKLNRVADARFAVRNPGGKTLHVREVRTSCGCAGLEVEIDGRLEVAKEFDVPARGERACVLRWPTHGSHGRSSFATVFFRTDDPVRPEVQVRCVVPSITGEVVAYPPTVQFGRFVSARGADRVVEVRDNGSSAAAVERVEVVPPGRLTVAVGELVDDESPLLGRPVARLAVGVSGGDPGPVEATLRVYLVGRPDPLDVPVSGHGAAAVELSPADLYLPARSGNGPVFTAQVICRSPDGSPFTLAVVEPPPGVRATIEGGTPPQPPPLFVVSRDRTSGPERRTVRLDATAAGRATPITLTVHCRTE